MKVITRNNIFALLFVAYLVTSVFISIFIMGCTESNSASKDVVSDAGVVVTGLGPKSTVENTNDFPVRIKKVQISGTIGEVPVWLKLFNPGDKIEDNIWKGNAFYIYSTNGVLIGLIPCRNVNLI